MPTYSKLVLPAGRRPTNRLLRLLRALWRDTTALLTEFRASLLLFVIVTVGGGFLYGELHVLAGKPRLDFYQLPLLMVELMVLETPIEMPAEPYLLIFWYALPPIAVFILGRGAADFVRLFFDRTGRRDAWEEAVASTYRNHVVVLGLGHVGLGVVRTLVDMGFEVVGVDIEIPPELDAELHALGVPAIVGDGRNEAIMHKAGLAHADAFLACTSIDYVNVEAIMRARDMNPDIRIVARMFDNRSATQLKRFMGVQAAMSSAQLSAPVFAGAAVGIEITQTITVGGEEYSMVRLTVEAGSFMDGRTIRELQHSQNIDIVLHGRGESIDIHPDSGIVVQAGDTLVLFAHHRKITDVVARNRPNKGQK